MTAVALLTRVRVVVDHTMPTPLQRPTRLHLLSKTSWASVFLCIISPTLMICLFVWHDPRTWQTDRQTHRMSTYTALMHMHRAVKCIEKNACSWCFWQKMMSWLCKDTDQHISARSLTLLIFAVGWALCGRPQPEHESVMPLLSLSPLNVFTH